MDIFFHDPDDIPLPPEKVHIRNFRASLYPDGRRVRVYLEISPFLQRPSGEVIIYDEAGDVISSVNIIETVDPRLELTIHLRKVSLGNHTIRAILFYDAGSEETEEHDSPYHPQNRAIVDQAETNFTIPRTE